MILRVSFNDDDTIRQCQMRQFERFFLFFPQSKQESSEGQDCNIQNNLLHRQQLTTFTCQQFEYYFNQYRIENWKNDSETATSFIAFIFLIGPNKNNNMKGQLYANPTFIRKNIRQPTVISIRPLVAYDDSRLYFNNLAIKWQAKDIVNCTYSNVYKVLLVLTDDFKIYVFTVNLELITQLNNWQPKYIVGFELIQDLNMMLLIGTEQIELMRVNVVSNVKRTKFLSSMKFNIKREAHLAVQPQNKLKWNKGYGYVVSQDLLYLWSLQDIHFYSLQKLTIRTKITNIAKKQVSITTVYFSNYYKYTITGLLNGDIKVWRLPINPLYSQKEILIHNFSYHSREVQQIIQGENEKTIITYGLDLYVCFMSIETFQILRTFNFVGQYTKLYLYDYLFAYAIKDGYLGELNYGKNLEFIAEITGAPIYHDYSPHAALAENSIYDRIQLTLASNLGIQLDLKQIKEQEDVNKIELTHIYPPLKSKNITQIVSCPFYKDVFYILVEDGDVFRAKLQGNMGRINEHYVVSKIHDSEKHVLHQTATYISFFHIVPPEIDTQIIEKTVDKTFKANKEEKQMLYSKLKLLTIGCNRGSIIFVSVDNMESIYARISYHREKIINFKEIFNKETNKDWLVSICEERYMKMINFQGNKANCLYTIFCGEVYTQMYGFQSHLAIVFQRGLFQLANFVDYGKQPTIVLNRQSINHQDDIISMSYRPDMKLILTGGLDNRIKIWTTYKILLYEIIIDQTLKYCLWGSDMSVILVQNTKLCCLRNIPLHFKSKQIENYNKQFESNYLYDDEIQFSRYFEDALAKCKEKSFKIRPPKKHQSLHESPVINRNAEQSKRMATSPARNEMKQLNKSGILQLKTPTKQKSQTVKTQGSNEQKNRQESDLQAIKKHLQQLSNLKKVTNESVLPKIKPKYEDIFVEFMRQKLLNKKLLTRRDITLNRIIMKNLIKDHLGRQNEIIKNFKLE